MKPGNNWRTNQCDPQLRKKERGPRSWSSFESGHIQHESCHNDPSARTSVNFKGYRSSGPWPSAAHSFRSQAISISKSSSKLGTLDVCYSDNHRSTCPKTGRKELRSSRSKPSGEGDVIKPQITLIPFAFRRLVEDDLCTRTSNNLLMFKPKGNHEDGQRDHSRSLLLQQPYNRRLSRFLNRVGPP